VPPATPVPGPQTPVLNIDPKIVAAAAEWTEYIDTKVGRAYYHNSKAKLSIWEKPKALLDLEQAKHVAMMTPANAKAKEKAADEVHVSPPKKVKKVIRYVINILGCCT
jgi:hypothetical protein